MDAQASFNSGMSHHGVYSYTYLNCISSPLGTHYQGTHYQGTQEQGAWKILVMTSSHQKGETYH